LGNELWLSEELMWLGDELLLSNELRLCDDDLVEVSSMDGRCWCFTGNSDEQWLGDLRRSDQRSWIRDQGLSWGDQGMRRDKLLSWSSQELAAGGDGAGAANAQAQSTERTTKVFILNRFRAFSRLIKKLLAKTPYISALSRGVRPDLALNSCTY
jgi:hypothetical protein